MGNLKEITFPKVENLLSVTLIPGHQNFPSKVAGGQFLAYLPMPVTQYLPSSHCHVLFYTLGLQW